MKPPSDPVADGHAGPPSERAARFGRTSKVVLVNLYLLTVGVLLALLIPFRSNFSPIRGDVLQGGAGDIHRLRPNLRDEPYLHGAPPGIGIHYSPITVSTNAEGFRDRDHPLEKAPGTFRVAVFGDSFVFGLAVAQAETLPNQLDASSTDRERHTTRP